MKKSILTILSLALVLAVISSFAMTAFAALPAPGVHTQIRSGDLEVVSVTTDHRDYKVGDTVKATVTIRNNSATERSIGASIEVTCGTFGKGIGFTGVIQPGEDVTKVISVYIATGPAKTMAQKAKIIATVDPSDNLKESNERNNSASTVISVSRFVGYGQPPISDGGTGGTGLPVIGGTIDEISLPVIPTPTKPIAPIKKDR